MTTGRTASSELLTAPLSEPWKLSNIVQYLDRDENINPEVTLEQAYG